MSSSEKEAWSVGGEAARACNSCLRRRARWYCAADDAFLCQGCDTSVHLANPLARRHERLRLRSSSPTPQSIEGMGVALAWSKRKARTRRPQVKSVGQLLSRRLVVVPEVAVESSEERKAEEEGAEGEQLLYRVPIFDPALAEFCSPPPIDDTDATTSCCMEDVDGAVENTRDPVVAASPVQQLPDCFANFGPTDAKLREFAADMEALLGRGLDDSNELEDSFYMETLGLELISPAEDGGRVKVEPDGVVSNSGGARASSPELKPEVSAEVLDIGFNCSSPTVVDDDDGFDQKTSAGNGATADAQFFQRSLDLRLNYKAIIESWGGSPWTDGQRPHVKFDNFWPDEHTGMWTAGKGRHGDGVGTPRPRMDGAGREARVTRYREKRRTRLFAKKIRYEVRKLNAEKRPRMKGRFVKRPTGGGAAVAATPCAVT